MKSLPSSAPGCSLPPLGPGSLLPCQKLDRELLLSLLVASLPCWMRFGCPAGTASSTETHPACGWGSPAGFFQGNKTQIRLNPGGRKRTEICISLSSLISGSEDQQGSHIAATPAPCRAVPMQGKDLFGEGLGAPGALRSHRPARCSPPKSKNPAWKPGS